MDYIGCGDLFFEPSRKVLDLFDWGYQRLLVCEPTPPGVLDPLALLLLGKEYP